MTHQPMSLPESKCPPGMIDLSSDGHELFVSQEDVESTKARLAAYSDAHRQELKTVALEQLAEVKGKMKTPRRAREFVVATMLLHCLSDS